MGRQEKGGKIFFALFALTAVFLCVLASPVRDDRQLWQTSSYTVQTQFETEEEIAPKRELINVNTASAEELEELTGIGPALAQEIVSYREGHGAFSCAEDLLNVKGIGEAKLEGFRVEITF